MNGRGLALSLTPEIMSEINSDCVKAYLNNNISREWAAVIKSLVMHRDELLHLERGREALRALQEDRK